jgi:predicted metal-dependent hydrolase
VTSWRARPELAEGLRLLATGDSRAAHEAFEDAWRAHRSAPIGDLARALSQWAAACVHWESQRESGFRSLAAKCAAAVSHADIVRQFGTSELAAWMLRVAAGNESTDPRVLP